MKRFEKAYSLNEMLILTTLAGLIMAFQSRIIVYWIKEIPWLMRSSSSQTSTEAMLEQLRQDVEQARRMNLNSQDNRLTLEGPKGQIVYVFEPEQMRRESADPNQIPPSTWTLPNIQLTWSIYETNGRAAALEVHTRWQQVLWGQPRTHFRRVSLFFAGLRKETDYE
jgi:alkyl sulfatase BDS1-like metallo-beta-lactamase superfamily hydrolase